MSHHGSVKAVFCHDRGLAPTLFSFSPFRSTILEPNLKFGKRKKMVGLLSLNRPPSKGFLLEFYLQVGQSLRTTFLWHRHLGNGHLWRPFRVRLIGRMWRWFDGDAFSFFSWSWEGPMRHQGRFGRLRRHRDLRRFRRRLPSPNPGRYHNWWSL